MATPDQIKDYIEHAQNKAWQLSNIPSGTNSRPVTSVGVIGAGTMGGGISMNFATVGIEVKIIETTQEALDRGLALCRKNYQRSADKGRFSQQELEERMERIQGSLNMEDLAGCDLIIEAVFENMELKKSIFSKLDAIAKPGAILATNSSALDIDEIASVTKRPEDVIGMHFFSPANVMKLVEVVQAEHTADDVVATMMHISKKIQKIAALVGVCPGFVGNRILYARQTSASKLVYKGVMPSVIDAAFNAFGFRMGPFQMSDLAGLDIGWQKGATTANPIRDALCELDHRGQKTGHGYYIYDENRVGSPSPVAEKIIRDITGVSESDSQSISNEEIIANCVFPMINEATKILEENKAQRPSDIDVVWLYGYGWPQDKGGLLFFADTIGAEKILAKMEELGADDDRFKPTETLKKLAKDGGKFTELDLGGLKTGTS